MRQASGPIVQRPAPIVVLVFAVCVGLSSCARMRKEAPSKYVYVTSKQTFLRDRVAAVSNRTATVENGDKLKVLERGRRFIKVQTEKGEVGWIDEKLVVTGDVLAEFDELKAARKDDPVVATAVVRDEVYLHLAPGRESEHYYRLAEGEKLSLLQRATLTKPASANAAHAEKAIPQALGSTASKTKPGKLGAKPETDEPAPPVMEDWWLVRDSHGDTGWLYARKMDVDAPDSIVRYSEGQRIVGAYVLETVNDPEANETGGVNVPVYVTVMAPYKAGLPYDFDQVRVFTWNLKKHRYETGFRERNIEGYLPVTVAKAIDRYAQPGSTGWEAAPTFMVKVLAAGAPPVTPDPATGAMVPTKTVTQTFRLEGERIRRVAAPGAPLDAVAHPDPIEEKKGKETKRR